MHIEGRSTQRMRVEEATPRQAEEPAKKTLTASPSASVNASVISTAAPGEATATSASRQWSTSSSAGMPSSVEFRPSMDTPMPERPSRLSNVMNFFKRSSSAHRFRPSSQHDDARLTQRVVETKEVVRGQIEEIEKLKRQLAINETELAERRGMIASLQGTQAHAQELLERNSDLEFYISQLQDEADAMLEKERNLRQKAVQDIAAANQRAEAFNSRIHTLERELRDAQHSTTVSADLIELRRSLAEKETLISQLRFELKAANVEVSELKSVVEREKLAIDKLLRERQSHMSNIEGVSTELKGLLEQNNELEEEIRNAAERNERLIEEMKVKLREANADGQSKAQQVARLQAELEVLEANRRRSDEALESLKQQNEEMRTRIIENQTLLEQVDMLKTSLAESEERRHLENTRAEEVTKRLKEQVMSLQGIHKRAENLLARNAELEKLLADFTDKLSNAVGDDAPVVRRLRSDLHSVTSELRSAEQRMRTQENDLKLLEGTLRDTKRRLQAAEMEVERRRHTEGGTPMSNVNGEAFTVALEKALTANADSTRREIARLQREYDALIRNIREAHQRDLDTHEVQLQEKLRQAALDKDEELAGILRQKEAEWAEIRAAQDRALQEAQRNQAQLQATISRLKEAMKAQDEEVRFRVDAVRREAQNEMSERIADLKKSVEGLVSHATNELRQEVDSLKATLSQAQQDRDVALDENLKLGRSVNVLKATVEEKDNALAHLARQHQELEQSSARQLEDLRSVLREQKTSTLEQENLRRMLQRNGELEETIAKLSEKYHSDMQIRMEEVAKTRRQKLDLESRVNAITRELNQLQQRSAQHKGMSEVERADLDRKIVELSGQLARSEAQRKALSDELENERKRIQMLQRRPVRPHDGDRRDWKQALLERVAEMHTLAQTYQPTVAAASADVESARASAEQKRLAAEIDHLKSQVMERQEKIEGLEHNLQQFRVQRPTHDVEKDKMRLELQSLQGERKRLSEACDILEDHLRKQRENLAAEISRRDQQLTGLRKTNEELGRALKRNAELEEQLNQLFEDLRSKLTPSSGHEIAYTSVFETITAFESEFRSRTFQYDMDMKQMAANLDEREAEVFRLQQELSDLRQELQRNQQQQLESQRLQFEAEREALLSENRALRDVQKRLQDEMAKLRTELAEAQAVDSERVTRMVAELNNKITEHQLLVAELSDEKDNEVRRIEGKLKASMAAQERLRVEIDTVTRELSNKESDIVELSTTIKRIMHENGINPEGLEKATGSEQWSGMIGTIETMFTRLSRSRKDAGSLCTKLNALLQEQQRSLTEIAESQTTAARLRQEMADTLASSNKEGSLGRAAIRSTIGIQGGPIGSLNSTFADIDKNMETVRQTHIELLAAQSPRGRASRLASKMAVITQHNTNITTTLQAHTSTTSSRNTTEDASDASPVWRPEQVPDSNKRKIDAARVSESKRLKFSRA